MSLPCWNPWASQKSHGGPPNPTVLTMTCTFNQLDCTSHSHWASALLGFLCFSMLLTFLLRIALLLPPWKAPLLQIFIWCPCLSCRPLSKYPLLRKHFYNHSFLLFHNIIFHTSLPKIALLMHFFPLFMLISLNKNANSTRAWIFSNAKYSVSRSMPGI